MYYIEPKIENFHRFFYKIARKDFLRLDLNENPDSYHKSLFLAS